MLNEFPQELTDIKINMLQPCSYPIHEDLEFKGLSLTELQRPLYHTSSMVLGISMISWSWKFYFKERKKKREKEKVEVSTLVLNLCIWTYKKKRCHRQTKLLKFPFWECLPPPPWGESFLFFLFWWRNGTDWWKHLSFKSPLCQIRARKIKIPNKFIHHDLAPVSFSSCFYFLDH